MKIKTLLFALSVISLVFASGFVSIDKTYTQQNCAGQISGNIFRKIDLLKENIEIKSTLDREMSLPLRREYDFTVLDAYPESGTTSESESTAVNEKLIAYLTELNEGTAPTQNTFNSLTTLTFDGSASAVCNEIVEITGLSDYTFDSITQIEIKNMSNLTTVDLNGLVGTRSVFPNLDTIIVDNCALLTSLSFAKNNAIKTLKINSCPQVSFNLPNEVQQTLEKFVLTNSQNTLSASIDVMLPKAKSLELVNTGVSTLAIDCAVLTKATITDNANLNSLAINASELIDLKLQNNIKLQKLDLEKCVNIQNLTLDEMKFEENGIIVSRTLIYAPNLQIFFLSGNDWLTQIDLSYSPNLQTVALTKCTNLEKFELANTLSSLITLDLTDCRNLLNVNILSAVNLTKLSLSGCNQLKNAIFDNISSYSKLQYLDLSSTGVQHIDFQNFEKLEILFLGSTYLSSVKLDTLPKLYQFEISNSSNLKQIELINLEKLKTFTPQYCDGIETISIKNTALDSFNISGKSKLNSLILSCTELKNFIVYNCNNLVALDFAECQKLTTLEIVGCSSLVSESLVSLKEISTLEKVTVSECLSVYSFSLEDKLNLTMLDLSYLNNLTALSLSNLGQTPRIYLPSKMTGIRSLTLVGLARAQFGTDTLDLSHGVLSSVRISNVPFTKINFCDNMLVSVNISGTKNLQEINLSNNRITSVDTVMTLLSTCNELGLVNLNNNRIDFSNGNSREELESGMYANCVVLGLQNAINNNKYTYEPKIYYGGTGIHYENLRVVVYYSSRTYKISEISETTLQKFSHSNFQENRFKKCKNGTYYIVFEKVDSNGNKIAMTDDEKSQFIPVYFVVAREFDIIKFIWIIFLGVAGLIFAYVGISWLIERRRKQRLYDEEFEEIMDGNTKLSRKEIKLAERQQRNMFKENDKLDRQERKNRSVEERERSKIEKENSKEQQRTDAENEKLAKIADKERSKEEKAKEKELKKEQKELKRMEQKNVKEDRRREKYEERGILNDKFANSSVKKFKKDKNDIDVDAYVANKGVLNTSDTQLDIDGGISDKDLAEISLERNRAPKCPTKAPSPKLPPRPKK